MPAVLDILWIRVLQRSAGVASVAVGGAISLWPHMYMPLSVAEVALHTLLVVSTVAISALLCASPLANGARVKIAR